MSKQQTNEDFFESGAEWVRADFHLHTRADKQFSDQSDSYHADYIDALSEAEINIGAITNHNKFDFTEYKTLRKKAAKKGICLLPGVELSVGDGANGVHTLIIFSDDWIKNDKDRISPFLSGMFSGKAEDEYQHEDGRSDKSLIQVIEALDHTDRDYFVIFAHVEQRSGLWNEFAGGRIADIATESYACVRRRCLGFQKVRTHDTTQMKGAAGRLCRTKVKQHLGDWYPADVEGSDPKSIAEIGKGKPCYLKVGETSYSATKFALTDPEERVRLEEPEEPTHSRIESIEFEGGIFNGLDLSVSSAFNSLIGIRGSGKSSVIEAIRFTLGLSPGEDEHYKNELIPHVFGSGGRITLHVVDANGHRYKVKRTVGEESEIFDADEKRINASIRKTILGKPIYFGQKDLSAKGEGCEETIIERLLGEVTAEPAKDVERRSNAVKHVLQELAEFEQLEEELETAEENHADANHQKKAFKDHGVVKQLAKQTAYERDAEAVQTEVKSISGFVSDLETLLEDHCHIDQFGEIESTENPVFCTEFKKLSKPVQKAFSVIEKITSDLREAQIRLEAKRDEFTEIHDGVREELSETRRTVAVELEEAGVANLNPDDYPKLEAKISTLGQKIAVLKREQSKKTRAEEAVYAALGEMRESWRKEFNSVEAAIEKINSGQDELEISSTFRGNRASFLQKFKETFRGSGIREATFQKMVDQFGDFTLIYEGWEKANRSLGGSRDLFWEWFEKKQADLLTFQVPNSFSITYKGKDLNSHSLGQRASALILFVLSKRDSDLILIDQPEDDLDNQTIYQDVISLLKQMKTDTQFIFATHNANFPVLGDAEMVHCFDLNDRSLSVKSGSIDKLEIQDQIVKIMEGGEDAFLRRKQIYELWS